LKNCYGGIGFLRYKRRWRALLLSQKALPQAAARHRQVGGEAKRCLANACGVYPFGFAETGYASG